MIEPVKRSRLYESVAGQIKTLIKNGTLKIGDQLPPERELAIQLNVSRSSLRQALGALAMGGYLESKVGVNGGTFIKEVSASQIVEPFAMALYQRKDFALETLEVRMILEVEIAKLAAERRNEEDLARIDESLVSMKKDIVEGGIGLVGDSDFHYSLAKAAHNEVLLKVIDIWTQLSFEMRRDTLELPGESEKALDDHKKILNSIRDQDAQKAATLMHRHLAKAMRNISMPKAKQS